MVIFFYGCMAQKEAVLKCRLFVLRYLLSTVQKIISTFSRATPGPFQGRAISQAIELIPVVHGAKCVGCGICQKVCPTDEEAIRVVRAE